MIFNSLNKIKAEIAESVQSNSIESEADDIIGTIVHMEGKELNVGEQSIPNLSGDKDYIQLHKPM